MADAEASAPTRSAALRGCIAMKRRQHPGPVSSPDFYKSPACARPRGPKGALKLLRNVENSGLKFTHMPHLNKWIIALDHDAPPPPPASDLRAGAEFVPGGGYAPVDDRRRRAWSRDPRLRQAARMESLEALCRRVNAAPTRRRRPTPRRQCRPPQQPAVAPAGIAPQRRGVDDDGIC